MRPEEPSIEARGAKSGGRVLGEGQPAPPHASAIGDLGSAVSCKSQPKLNLVHFS